MKSKDIFKQNVFGNELEECSKKPLTGFLRDGCCSSLSSDRGQHFVCAVMTNEFLRFSLNKGNDLLTPIPEFNFPGLKSGDKWCLCADRWIESYNENCAPKIYLKSTNELILKKINLEILKKFALDIN